MSRPLCPHCNHPLPDPRPETCPNCGELIEPVGVSSLLRRAMGYLPALLLAISPLIFMISFSFGGEALELFYLAMIALITFTFAYSIVWARSYVNAKGQRGMHWSLLAILMIIVNFALGFGGCFAVGIGMGS